MMVANEVYAEPSDQYNSTDQWQDYYDEEEAEETLSLCDLPTYNGSFESDDRFSSSKEDYQSSSDDQDFFEFFSADFSTASSTCAYADNIIFCGKLIPYQNPAAISQENTHKVHQINKEQPPRPPKKKMRFFQWRSKFFDKSKISKDNTTKRQINSNISITTKKKKKNNYSEHQKVLNSKTLALPASNKCSSANKKCGYSVKKVSILTSPTKSRWHLFFGLARLPTEMELCDMRSRQHRRTPSSSTLFPSFDEANKCKEVNACKPSRGKGLWRLLRILGCRNSDANTVVKASFGCIPRL